MDHVKRFSKVPGVEIAAVCEIDENVLGTRLADIEKLDLPKPRTFTDVRKVLDDQSIDAISVAAPNHWHSLMRGLCFKWRDTIGRQPRQAVPGGVDYDLWLGPAPDRGFTLNRFHYNWHWFWDTGNGDLGNQGIHEVDIARWGLGVKFPSKVSAIGAKVMFDDDQETPKRHRQNREADFARAVHRGHRP